MLNLRTSQSLKYSKSLLICQVFNWILVQIVNGVLDYLMWNYIPNIRKHAKLYLWVDDLHLKAVNKEFKTKKEQKLEKEFCLELEIELLMISGGCNIKSSAQQLKPHVKDKLWVTAPLTTEFLAAIVAGSFLQKSQRDTFLCARKRAINEQ